MIRTILVPTSGSATDAAVFATALALARPTAAHLEFYHVRLSTAEAVARAPHLSYCVGPALPQAIEAVRRKEQELASNAAAHFKTFCRENALEVREAPGISQEVSASWREDTDFAVDRFMLHARHCDLIVLGRSQHADYMPAMLLEDLLTACGRPCVIAPRSSPRSVTGTIIVGWKETKEAARALAAAYPLLERATTVILLSITEHDGVETAEAARLEHLAHELKWHGIIAQACVIAAKSSAVTSQLAKAAQELNADMLVVGGFGHGRLRELIFGGVTQSLIDHADLPVFMLH